MYRYFKITKRSFSFFTFIILCIWRMLCGNTYSFFSVFKNFSCFFKTALFFYTFSLKISLNKLFQFTWIISPWPIQNFGGIFMIKKNWNLKELFFSFKKKETSWKLNKSLKGGFVFNPSNPKANLSLGLGANVYDVLMALYTHGDLGIKIQFYF